jgi:demethylmenaquinone methyltransferase/2-methoxy-6-polyprenyl-1,4-benzoquinol methylase
MSHPAPPGSPVTSPGARRGGAHDELPTGPEKTVMVRSMFDAIAPRYDLVNRMMTFGLDIRWRRRSVRALGLPPGARVLDLACGTGDFLTILAGSGYHPVGMDLSLGMLEAGRSQQPVAEADAASLPVADAAVDGITCGYALRNFTELGPVFAELGRIVRPGGRISLLEVAEPESGLLLAGHRIWFRRVVPVIGGLVSDGAAYRYLPKSTAYLPTEAARDRALRRAGGGPVSARGRTPHRPVHPGRSDRHPVPRRRPSPGGARDGVDRRAPRRSRR